MATTLLRVRVETVRARRAKAVLAGLGIKPAEAVNMLFAQVVARQGLPFPLYRDETAELLDNPQFMRQLKLHRAGKLKFVDLDELPD